MKKLIIYILLFGISLSLYSCNNESFEDDSEIFYSPLEIDTTSRYTVSEEIFLESSKAEKTKFDVEMIINLPDLSSENSDGNSESVVAHPTPATEIPLNTEFIILEIFDGNDDISIVCYGPWRLEKLVDGKYIELINTKGNKKKYGDVTCIPNSSCFVSINLNEYYHLLSEGKYRFISPTLYITKDTEEGLQDYTYQNEKAFILYSEFEFVK